jgi:hypothetical protein
MRRLRLHQGRFALMATAMFMFWFAYGFDSPQSNREASRNQLLFVVSMAVMVIGGLRLEPRTGQKVRDWRSLPAHADDATALPEDGHPVTTAPSRPGMARPSVQARGDW